MKARARAPIPAFTSPQVTSLAVPQVDIFLQTINAILATTREKVAGDPETRELMNQVRLDAVIQPPVVVPPAPEKQIHHPMAI